MTQRVAVRTPSTAHCMPRQMPKNGIRCSRGIVHSDDLAFDAALAEARAPRRYRILPLSFSADILWRDLFGVDIAQLDLAVVHGACMDERFADRLVSVGQFGIFADQRDVRSSWPGASPSPRRPSTPPCRVRFSAGRFKFVEHHLVEVLFVHLQRHFVDRRHVDRLHHGVGVDIAEQRHLAAQVGRQRMLRAQHEDVGLQPRFRAGP